VDDDAAHERLDNYLASGLIQTGVDLSPRIGEESFGHLNLLST
jgi:hypothetical protein